MGIAVDFSAPRRTSPGQYALRFVRGGLVAVGTGLIAQHERRRKLRAGISCRKCGRKAAALDARAQASALSR